MISCFDVSVFNNILFAGVKEILHVLCLGLQRDTCSFVLKQP